MIPVYHHRRFGFTLLELLLAIAILSIITVLTNRGLHLIITSQERINAQDSAMEHLQLTLTLLRQDLQQVVNRPVLNNQGQTEAAMLLIANQLNFTRSGFTNPQAKVKRSTLQRVAYRCQQNTLQRLSWPVLDRSAATDYTVRNLLPDVSGIHWRFLDKDNHFHHQWPLDNALDDQPLPKAVELQLDFTSGKQLTQLILLTDNALMSK